MLLKLHDLVRRAKCLLVFFIGVGPLTLTCLFQSLCLSLFQLSGLCVVPLSNHSTTKSCVRSDNFQLIVTPQFLLCFQTTVFVQHHFTLSSPFCFVLSLFPRTRTCCQNCLMGLNLAASFHLIISTPNSSVYYNNNYYSPCSGTQLLNKTSCTTCNTSIGKICL